MNFLLLNAPQLDELMGILYGLVNWLMPLAFTALVIAGAATAIPAGIKMMRAEDAQSKELAKGRFKNIIIGFGVAVIIVLILWLARVPIIDWLEDITNGFGLS